jgi:predicted dehydrogenase/nucleoside-diphosphate-sugar epimerase
MQDSEKNAKTSVRRLRVALIGCGKMGLQHIKAISQSGHAELVAVADPVASEQSVRPHLPASTRFYADAGEMIAHGRPDVVHIVTPPETHVELAIRALSADCHVYIEKPFAPTRVQAAEILSLATARGLIACAGHQYLQEAPALEALEALPSIGRVELVESYFSFRKVRRNLSDVEQCKDILPHAVYPLLQQLRAGNESGDAPVEILGIDAKHTGDLHALLRLGTRTGVLCVTLSGRPIEQYQHIVGTTGSLRVDYVTDAVVQLLGPGTGIGILLTPFRRARQTFGSAIRTAFRVLSGRRPSYPGLHALVRRFYGSIIEGTASPTAFADILDTVDVCERMNAALDRADHAREDEARIRLEREQLALQPTSRVEQLLVTGGTGFLGQAVARELRQAGFRTRVLARRIPAPSKRLAGVEYCASDLGREVPVESFKGVDTVVHCAAETAGGKNEHERNSVIATRNVVAAAAVAGVRRIIHISSLAVLKPGSGAASPLDEASPVDSGNVGRGPYVWGKAESEQDVRRLAAEHGIELRVIRPGPLVDYANFEPPGRLGRELGPWYFAVGGRSSVVSVCDVGTAARVVRSFVEDFTAAPPILNLVESPAPTRMELVKRLAALRPDLRVRWIPALIVRLANGPAKLAQRVLLRNTAPVDVYAAFSSEHYNSEKAALAIGRARSNVVNR